MMTATYTCNTGYNLTGDMTRTCGANGTWSWTALTCDRTLNCFHDLIIIPTYIAVDCGSLSDPGNGIVDASNTTLMNTATYTCNTGYNLTGDTTRTCQANGTWSGTAACTRKLIVFMISLLYLRI